MPITIDDVRKIAVGKPGNWLYETGFPLPDAQDLQMAAEWQRMAPPKRKELIEEIRLTLGTVPLALFLLWTWEPSAELRKKIVQAFPADDLPTSKKALEIIFRNETPDAEGRGVRDEAFRAIAARAQPQQATLGMEHTLGGPGTAESTLAELRRLRTLNPWL